MSDRLRDEIEDRLGNRPYVDDDGSGSYCGSVCLTVNELIDLQALIGAPIKIDATTSDPACETWGSVVLSWPAPVAVDPLHARARAAIERLGLDGSRLELAVAVFGWGSDEANGSLLGLARVAWHDPYLHVRRVSSGWFRVVASVHSMDEWDPSKPHRALGKLGGRRRTEYCPTSEIDALVVALEAAP